MAEAQRDAALPPNPPYRLAPHRRLSLAGGGEALLASHSTGWCIVPPGAGSRLEAFLAGLTGEPTDPAERATLAELWNAGLLHDRRGGHPAFERKQAPYPTSLLLKLTGSCNFSCDYCYDYDAKRFKARLSLDSVVKTIDYLASRVERLSIFFHGGEPLLRFDLIRAVVDHVLRLPAGSARISFGVQTNAALLDPDIADYLDEHRFSVGISLDGHSEASNRLRTTHGAFSALAHVLRLLETNMEFVRRCGFLAVASRASADGLPDFAAWLQEKGISGLTISFLDRTGKGAGLGAEQLTPDEAVALYARFVGMIRTGELRALGLRCLIGRITNLFEPVPRDFCHKGPCAAADDFLVLDAEGRRRSCDCLYHPFFELDRPGDGPEAVGATNPRRGAVEQRHRALGAGEIEGVHCGTCALFGLCGGTCVAKAIAATGRPEAIDPVECAISRYLYPELLEEFDGQGLAGPLFAYARRHRADRIAPNMER